MKLITLQKPNGDKYIFPASSISYFRSTPAGGVIIYFNNGNEEKFESPNSQQLSTLLREE